MHPYKTTIGSRTDSSSSRGCCLDPVRIPDQVNDTLPSSLPNQRSMPPTNHSMSPSHSMKRHQQRNPKIRSTAITFYLWVAFAVVAVLLCGHVSASSESGYRGALPQELDGPLLAPTLRHSRRQESMEEQNYYGHQRLSDFQEPARWNNDCLMQLQQHRQQQQQQRLPSSSGDWNRQHSSFQKRGDNQEPRIRGRSAAADVATGPVVPPVVGGGGALPFYNLAVVNSTDMLCNGRADICDLRYNQVVSISKPFFFILESRSMDLALDPTDIYCFLHHACNDRRENCTHKLKCLLILSITPCFVHDSMHG